MAHKSRESSNEPCLYYNFFKFSRLVQLIREVWGSLVKEENFYEHLIFFNISGFFSLFFSLWIMWQQDFLIDIDPGCSLRGLDRVEEQSLEV